MTISLTKHFQVLFLICITAKTFTALGQPKPDTERIKKTYKNSHVIFLNKEQHFRIKTVKGKIDAECDFSQQIYHIDNKGMSFSERQVGYLPDFFTISKISATTYVPEKDGYKTYPVKTFSDEGRVDNYSNIFYDGMRFKKFKFTGIVPGTISEVKYTYKYIDPSYLGAYYFMMRVPVDQNLFTVTHSTEVEIGYAFFGDSSQIKHTITQKGKTITHKWEATQTKEIRSYPDAVDDRYFEPHVFIYIKQYKDADGKMQQQFGTIAQLYKNDYKYIEKVNQSEMDAGLKSDVDSIKNISKTRDDIIRNVYKYVQRNFKYIAFEDGEGGHVPREANDVYQKKFGDCKDFASLITYMLKYCDIPSYLCWIGTRDLPYTFAELPLGYSSNHMIAAVHNGIDWIFIDGTSKHIPFGMPSGFIQGKEAIIAINKDSFVLARVPILKPEINYSLDTVWLTIEGENLIGKGKVNLLGYNRSYVVDNLYYTDANKLTDQLKAYMRYGNNKREIHSISTNDYQNNDSVLTIEFSMTLPSYLKQIDKDIYLNMHLRKAYEDDRIDTIGGRMAAKEFQFLYFDESVFILDIPKNYSVKNIPEQKTYTDKNFTYTYTYQQSNNRIIYKQSSKVFNMLIEPEDFNQWNNQMDVLARIYKDNIILTEK